MTREVDPVEPTGSSPSGEAVDGQHRPVNVELLYFDGCPNWRETENRVRQALQLAGLSSDCFTLRQVNTAQDADREAFRGSPTVRVNGVDCFADPGAPVGLSCRLFLTPDGPAGAPALEQLVQALQSPPGS